jgi:hypothetical protein
MGPDIYSLDWRLREDAKFFGVRVVACPYSGHGHEPAGIDYRVQKRGLFGVWWTQATYATQAAAIAAAGRLVRGEPLHAAPPSPVVWP